MAKEDIEESLCGLLFNTMGYLHEYLKAKDDYNAVEIDGPRKFQSGDKVRIELNLEHDTCDSVKDAVAAANYCGTYDRQSGIESAIHGVQLDRTLNANERILLFFYDDEIFPLEDN